MTLLGLELSTWWFLVVGMLFAGYAVLDGFDLGAGAMHPFLRDSEDRRKALNAIGPVWDGNQVWLVIGGGALFAGFPAVYATLFSAFYLPLIFFLLALIFRAISIEFRSKEEWRWWRNFWDLSYGVSSIVAALLLGVVLGNVIQGLPIGADGEPIPGIIQYLNPYALLVGFTTLALFTMHGGLYLVLKSEGSLRIQLRKLVQRGTVIFVLLYILLTNATLLYVPKIAVFFKAHPWFFVLPLLGFLAVANVARCVAQKKDAQAFLSSAMIPALLMAVVALELYPNILVSTLDPAWSLNVQNASASDKTLGIMLGFAAVGTPLILAYTIFSFWTFRGKVKLDDQSY
jgi:cytochrome d ubiquinol oxidase subunit II